MPVVAPALLVLEPLPAPGQCVARRTLLITLQPAVTDHGRQGLLGGGGGGGGGQRSKRQLCEKLDQWV